MRIYGSRRPTRIGRGLRIGTAVAVTAVLAAACSSSSGTSGGNSATTPDGSTAASSGIGSGSGSSGNTARGTPIVIGSIGSISGVFSVNLGPVPIIVNAWVDYTNSHGGINGYPVKVILKDDDLTPAKTLSSAQELIGSDKVMALAGLSTPLTGALASYVTAEGVSVVGGSSSPAEFLSNPDFFPSGTLNTGEFMAQSIVMKGLGKIKLGNMYCAESPACGQLDQDLGKIASSNGQSLKSVSISSTAPNYIAQCLVMKNAGVQGLFISDGTPVIVKVMSDCAQLGYHPLLGLQSGTVGNQAIQDPNLNGAVEVSANANFDDGSVPGVKAFLDSVDKQAPSLRTGSQWNDNLIYVWAGLELFKAAAEAGHLTPASTPVDVKAALYKLKNETLDGLAPPLTFVSGKPTFPACYFLSKIDTGQLVSQNGGKALCIPNNKLASFKSALNLAG